MFAGPFAFWKPSFPGARVREPESGDILSLPDFRIRLRKRGRPGMTASMLTAATRPP
jgi:hypothetical protein